MDDLLVLYEHPDWFKPLFAALDRRGLVWRALHLNDLAFDPVERTPPAPVILSRVAMSGFLRAEDHGLFMAEAALAHWAARGARVFNGAETLAIDRSKARQLSLVAGLDLAIPSTLVVHRGDQLEMSAATVGYPLLVKANIGGAGAGIARYDDADQLRAAVGNRSMPKSLDGVLLVQAFVPAREGVVTRIETLEGHYLYALDIVSDGGFDLCPADACLAQPGRPAVRMARANPAPALIDAAERIAKATRLDLGGVEVMIDDRDGTARFYDVNALSNFVADPLAVLGYDPHERLVDTLEAAITQAKAA